MNRPLGWAIQPLNSTAGVIASRPLRPALFHALNLIDRKLVRVGEASAWEVRGTGISQGRRRCPPHLVCRGHLPDPNMELAEEAREVLCVGRRTEVSFPKDRGGIRGTG